MINNNGIAAGHISGRRKRAISVGGISSTISTTLIDNTTGDEDTATSVTDEGMMVNHPTMTAAPPAATTTTTTTSAMAGAADRASSPTNPRFSHWHHHHQQGPNQRHQHHRHHDVGDGNNDDDHHRYHSHHSPRVLAAGSSGCGVGDGDGYQFALDEYAQTVAAGSSNDDGKTTTFVTEAQQRLLLRTGAQQQHRRRRQRGQQYQQRSATDNHHHYPGLGRRSRSHDQPSFFISSSSSTTSSVISSASRGGMFASGGVDGIVGSGAGGRIRGSLEKQLKLSSSASSGGVGSRHQTCHHDQTRSCSSDSGVGSYRNAASFMRELGRGAEGNSRPSNPAPMTEGAAGSAQDDRGGIGPDVVGERPFTMETSSTFQDNHVDLLGGNNYTFNNNSNDDLHQPSITDNSSTQPAQIHHASNNFYYGAASSPFEHDMPDATYEEYYGDAYTGGIIRYQYPNGYTGMRPRSCPWKLSIVICLMFTWLSFFIVGYCSDQADEQAGIQQYSNDEVIDDDQLVIEIRWCGSRPLYLMWVASMLITFLAASYCGVIGYIKLRDFAVANCRSQPPGVIEGKSDYYVRVDAVNNSSRGGGSFSAPFPHSNNINHNTYPTEISSAASGAASVAGSEASSFTNAIQHHHSHRRQSIYQADGTPQFWGAHIYRPTQAAVAITSR